MKKNKKKKFFSKKRLFPKILLFLILSFFSIVGVTYAIDVIGDYIKTQTSTGTGTNSNKITFSNKKTTYYIDKNDDNILTGDQLRGYYYDNIYGYFRLDWSQVLTENVRIISSSTNITYSYLDNNGTIVNINCIDGYKFGGEAYSKYMGKINFNFNSTDFVFYCNDDNDKKIYGKTYSNNLGFQELNGIKINIREKQTINNITEKVITQDDNNYIENTSSIQSNNNWNNNNIGGGDKYEIENSTIDELEGNVFWIIK